MEAILKNIFDEGELEKQATVAFFATVQNEKGRLVERQIEYYNMEVTVKKQLAFSKMQINDKSVLKLFDV